MTHPGKLALFDQARAEFGAEVDVLVEVYTGLAAGRGEGQAAADLTAFLGDSHRFSEVIVRALLATAVQIIAESRAATGGAA
jgi:hypothetical protein